MIALPEHRDRSELAALAEHCWQLVGITDDLAAPDAWIRRSLLGRDVFIQHFDGELRGFHNVCSHRGFPLRVEAAGVGPVRCGFHGWTYRGDGVPAHVPRNGELFTLSRERRHELALPAITVDTIGRFVFASRAAKPLALRSYLGSHANVLAALGRALGPVIYREREPLAASWRHYVEISLDDHHLGSIHPTTFGAFELAPYQVVYRRDGLHSSYLKRRDPHWSFDAFWAGLGNEAAPYDRTGYKTFQCFPTTVIATARDACVANTIAPNADGSASVESYIFDWRDDPHTESARAEIAAYFAQVLREDRDACARWACSTSASPPAPVLGALEERVGWFRESLAELLAPRTDRG